MGASKRVGYTFFAFASVLLLILTASCGGDDNEDTANSTDTSAPARAEEVVITIGNLTDITGASANAMRIIDMALEDLVAYYNEAILPAGVSLEVVAYDGQHDPSKNIPGYEWLKERGADLIFTGVVAAPVALGPRANQDRLALFAASVDMDSLAPPGYVFGVGTIPQYDAYTILKWIAGNDWDYQTNGPAKIGGACWIGSAGDNALQGMKEYAQTHPDQYEWVGSYSTNYTFTWTAEVDELKDCDYVFPPAVWPSFVKEYRGAGYTAKFIGTDVHMAFLGLIDDANLWDEIDQTIVIRSTRWWNEQGAIIDLTNEILEKRHPDSAEDIRRQGSGYISMHQINLMLEIVAEAIKTAGPDNFSSQVLYDVAQSYIQVVDGTQRSSFSQTKRDAVDAYGIYEVSAADKDIFRIQDNWIPTMREP